MSFLIGRYGINVGTFGLENNYMILIPGIFCILVLIIIQGHLLGVDIINKLWFSVGLPDLRGIKKEKSEKSDKEVDRSK